METGKIAAGTPTHKAEETLAKLKRLQESKTDAYVSTVRKLHRGEKLKRQMTRIEVGNKEDQKALSEALATLSKDSKGQDEATAAISQLVGNTPEMESLKEEEPRYGGIFRAKVLNRRATRRSMSDHRQANSGAGAGAGTVAVIAVRSRAVMLRQSP